jgi:ATP-binding cassette, subfamily C, bacteriocin exporter
VSRLVGVLEFVEKLPAGFATRIGQNGVLLSGGERQRIAIARALYLQPRLLILDEGTSALDSIAEDRVLETLTSFARSGGTVLLIAHRLTTATAADRIVVLENGRIVEEGTQSELLDRAGAYRRLWDRQLGAGNRLGELAARH